MSTDTLQPVDNTKSSLSTLISSEEPCVSHDAHTELSLGVGKEALVNVGSGARLL